MAIGCSDDFKVEADVDAEDAVDGMTDVPADVEPDEEEDVPPADVTDAEDVEDEAECGNSEVEGEEECDDGNAVEGDGCDNDCTYSCHSDPECWDDDICNGTESCGSESHMCEDGTPLDDGHLVDAGPPRIICLEGSSVTSRCGDGFVDLGGGEFCEPPSVGACDDACRWTCVDDGDCPDDGETCNGDEFCDTTAHVCDRTGDLADGTVCGSSSPRHICLSGTCQVSTCGDSFTDTVGGEECDDGADGDPDDGCTDTCYYSCHSDTDCDDSELCNGAETCGTVTTAGRVCQPGTDAGSGTACNDGLWCTVVDQCDGSGTCVGSGNICDDGHTCTTDVCNESGRTCTNNIDSSYCLISGSCIYTGTRNSSNECEEC
jgi:cysteine-rich repeat protein